MVQLWTISPSGNNSSRVAAVGDSTGDNEMLREAGLRFFLGANPPPDLEAIIHLPDGDIDTVATRILAEWFA
jgi:phosphoserine phosphatase